MINMKGSKLATKSISRNQENPVNDVLWLLLDHRRKMAMQRVSQWAEIVAVAASRFNELQIPVR